MPEFPLYTANLEKSHFVSPQIDLISRRGGLISVARWSFTRDALFQTAVLFLLPVSFVIAGRGEDKRYNGEAGTALSRVEEDPLQGIEFWPRVTSDGAQRWSSQFRLP